ncbi:hypothetical protein G9A89_011233 [Geosiphon pyriformis]|nr:hypothetical protein G9A89_011233 [Geosiphon pyriformis]
MSQEVADKDNQDASYFEIDNEQTILSLKLPQNLLSQWFQNRSIALFICLDISGSMAGSGINQAKHAILTLLEGVLTAGAVKEEDVTCFFFNHGCKEVPFATNPHLRWATGGIKTYFDKVFATGGTSFSSVFDSILNNIPNVNTDLAVIFFTDGQTSPVQQEKKDALAAALSGAKHGTEVHTVGFTGDHDAVILSWLTKLGTKQGNFQYVRSSGDIPNTMKTTLELLALGDRNAYVKIGGNEALRTSFDNDGRGRLVLTGENKVVHTKQVRILKDKESEETFTFGAIREVKPNEPEATLLMIPFIQNEITRLTNEVVSNSGDSTNRDKLNEIAEEAEKYDDKLNTILQNAYKIKSIWRNVTIQQCLSVKETLIHFKDLLSEALKGSLTNEKIATFNNLAYRNVTKQRLKKKLDDRTIKNIDQMEAIEERLQKLIKTIDFDELDRNETQENKLTFTCTLTTDNYIEAMREGECMCLTLDIARSQAAIADPTQLHVKKINQTFLTSDAFMTSVGYALDETGGDGQSVHGGFEGSSIGASVIKGVAREDITGILPLYINEQHWQIAKERIKPIMGYMTTLDVFGYSYSQLTSIPFLVLERAFSDTSLDFRRKQFRLVFETCDAIYKQSTKLREENKAIFPNYTKSPLNRTIDSVANNFVFLGHLLCAIRCGDVSLVELQQYLQEGLITFAIEETIRRRLNRAAPQIEEQFNNIQTLLGIDQKAYIDTPVEEFSKAYANYIKELKDSKKQVNNRYSNAFLSALSSISATEAMEIELPTGGGQKSVGMEIDEVPAPMIRIEGYDPEKLNITEKTLELLTKVEKVMSETVENILRYNEIFQWAISNNSTDLLTFPDFRKFDPAKTPLADEFFSQVTPKVKLATFLQAYIHRQNSARREAAEATPTKFVQPFSEATPDAILSTKFQEFLSELLKRKMTEIVDSYTKQANNETGLSFWEATTPEEAAGLIILDVKHRGKKVFKQVVKAFQKPHMPLAKEKLEMMVNGVWKGVQLFQDKFTKLPDKAIWRPSRENLHRILKAQKGNVSDVAYWVNLLPHYKDYIEHQFDEVYLADRRHAAWEVRQQKRGLPTNG